MASGLHRENENDWSVNTCTLVGNNLSQLKYDAKEIPDSVSARGLTSESVFPASQMTAYVVTKKGALS